MKGRQAVKVGRERAAFGAGARRSAAISAARIASRVVALAREISRETRGRRVDVVITLDRGFVFAADLIRQIKGPVVCHFVREDMRDIEQSGHTRREVFFGGRPELKGRDVLLVDAVLESGITQEFLLRRLGESRPRSIRMAVLLDKPASRRVSLEPDYFGFRTASKEVWVGYGLAAGNGTGCNLRQLVPGSRGASTRGGKHLKKQAGRAAVRLGTK